MLKLHYFGKLFEEYTGISFIAFVNTRKMEYAEKLLPDTDKSSAAYFIKKFKAHYGMTPNDYRNRKMRELQSNV